MSILNQYQKHSETGKTISQPAYSSTPEGAGIVETNAAPEGQSESRPGGRNSFTSGGLKTRKALESIAAEFTISQTASCNYQAVAPNGEILATGRSESRVREMAEAEYARRRRGSESRNRSVRLGNTTCDIVL